LIAIIPIEWAGGAEVWKSWERWDARARIASYYAALEHISRETLANGPPPDLKMDETQIREWRAKMAEAISENSQWKNTYRRALWHPWSDIE